MGTKIPTNAEAGAFLDIVKDSPPLDTQTAEQNRLDLQKAIPLTGEGAQLARVYDTEIAGVNVRVYSDSHEEGQPCVVYFHGGGWVIGDPDLADSTTRDLAKFSGATVVSVDYRRAPEHPFPAAHDDALAVTQALLAGTSGLKINPAAVAVAGDSAGGNLAAAVSQALRNNEPKIVHQALIYPCLDWEAIRSSQSWKDYGEGHFLTSRDLEYFYDAYASGVDPNNLRLNPGKETELSDLPRTTIITAECDPIRDSGESYARVLTTAGVEVTSVRFQGQVHPFIYMGGIMRDAIAARKLVGGELRASFASPE